MESDAPLTEHTQRLSLFQRATRFVRRFFLWFLIIVVALWSYGFYALGRSAVYMENPGLSGQQQATALLQKVGQLIQLPPNETPTMATINDAASAKKDQPFLANAENGDVLIVYQTAQIALLYRPSENKLIAVGPVTSAPTTGQGAQQSITVTPASATTTSSKNGITNTQTKK
ncbi:MAG: hypothetical protein ACYC6X_03030 [Minisyncoccota bacterium]